MGKPVVHFEVIGKDPGKLQKFYGQLFDWKVNTNNPGGYGLVDTDAGQGIPGGIGGGGQNPQDAQYGVTFYVQVPDPGATLRKAEQLGGKTLMQPTALPGGGPTLAAFTDPEGNRIGLTKG
jgi:predicted enzyme related to lactoylglutathione lyase